LELKKPNTVLEILDRHREYMYFPSPQVIQAMTEHYTAAETQYEEGVKAFFKIVKSKVYLHKPTDYHSRIIQRSFDEGDR